VRLVNPFEPYFVPIWVDVSRAEESIPAKVPVASHAFKNNAGIAWTYHFSCLFIDDSIDPTENPGEFAAKWHHLHIKR
jgi:hypothetical protein